MATHLTNRIYAGGRECYRPCASLMALGPIHYISHAEIHLLSLLITAYNTLYTNLHMVALYNLLQPERLLKVLKVTKLKVVTFLLH